MTAHEKWMMTNRYIRLVREKYPLLSRAGGAKMGRRARNETLCRWLEVINRVHDRLRGRKGKSMARAKRDWLVARTIEMLVFERLAAVEMQQSLTGPRPVTRQYLDALIEEAVMAIRDEAETAGLLGGEIAEKQKNLSYLCQKKHEGD